MGVPINEPHVHCMMSDGELLCRGNRKKKVFNKLKSIDFDVFFDEMDTNEKLCGICKRTIFWRLKNVTIYPDINDLYRGYPLNGGRKTN